MKKKKKGKSTNKAKNDKVNGQGSKKKQERGYTGRTRGIK